jgi:hypothetical protein
MSEMSDAEIYEMIMMHADQIDASFEFWLSISFGVLIAVHFLRAALTTKLRMLICTLYAASSLIAILFTFTDLMQIAALHNALSFELEGGAFNAFGSMVRLAVYFVGTVTVSLAVFKYENWIDGREN